MPLLNKKPFEKNIIPFGLKDTDKVFYCEVTNEIFDNYQEFAERIILCNSLVWACEETGKSGLTYVEAMECERNAKKLLNDFPLELRKPILYLITLTGRSALSDLTDDIFNYVRDRYFVGETLEYNLNTEQWVNCRVLHVTTPTSKELADFKNGTRTNEKQFWPPGQCYHYEIKLAKPETKSDVIHVSGSKLRRKKSTYTRDRNHLFIKHFVAKIDGIWKLKSVSYQYYDIGKVKFDEIFAGHIPRFLRSDTPKKVLKKSNATTQKFPHKNGVLSNKVKKLESIDKYLKPKILEKDAKSPKRVLNTHEKKQNGKDTVSSNKDIGGNGKSKQVQNKKLSSKRKSTEEILEQELLEKRKKMMEHQQQLFEKKQQKQLDIQRKRDEKKKLEEFMREWHKTREDLELEDLRELPMATPVCLNTPNEYFGELVMLYEFFQTFSEQANVKNFFPVGVTIDLLDRALSQQEVAGPLFDFIHLLLAAIFKLQEDEEDEIGETYDSFAVHEFDSAEAAAERINSNSWPSETNLTAVAINWPLAFQGVPLQKLPVDATTITEVLRLHLLASGSRVSETCNRWRTQEKGGYVSNDDPALAFRTQNPHIIQSLSEKCVAALSIAEKLAVLQCLVNQVIMFAPVRDIIHENVENCRHKRVELRVALAAEIKKEKELAQRKKEKKTTAAVVTTKASATEKSDNEKAVATKTTAMRMVDENEVRNNSEAMEKLEREIQKRKDDLKKQLADTMAENMKVQLAPLGMDRAYRRFWLFSFIPGIFVEDNEQNPPPCLPSGTPNPNAALMREKDTASYVRKLFQKEYNKENLGITSTMNSPKKHINNVMRYNNITTTASGVTSCTALSTDLVVDEEPNRVPFSCWGNTETCPVHCPSVPRVRWSYYRTESDYENLLNALNARGKRESKLRMILIQGREVILKNLSRPFVSLNKSNNAHDEASMVAEIRKSSRGNPTYENAMFDFPADADVENVLESLLRNIILEIEEKSSAGGLGCLRVSDRKKWINAIFNNTYDQLCDKLVWGPVNDEGDETNVEIKPVSKEKKYSNLGKFDVVNKFAKYINPKVKELACAILQLEQSIELHYLKPPLGMEKIKLNKGEATHILRRWESSLMSSTSFAQLFLHICTLDNSIAWNRSALNANCRICRRRGDPENMLLCDMCNKGHHLYCLKPKLTKIPKGDWFCHYCKPPSKEPAPKKNHFYSADSDDDIGDGKNLVPICKMDLSNKGKCEVCSVKGFTIGCSKCVKRYHLGCLIPPLRKPPTVNWSCHSCRRESAKKDENHINFLNELDSSCGEPVRVSRRKTSKAANEKIYRFVKQLRRQNSTDDEQFDECENDVVVKGGRRGRRTRHSLETNYVNQLPLDNAALQEMLNKIMHHEDAWPFLRPVSRFEAADYAQIIKRPMDFATIKHKLNMLQYHTNSQVISDSMLVFNNCFLYNKDTADVYKAGVRLMNYFKKLCEEMNFQNDLIEAENQSKRLNGDDELNHGEEEEVDDEESENAEDEINGAEGGEEVIIEDEEEDDEEEEEEEVEEEEEEEEDDDDDDDDDDVDNDDGSDEDVEDSCDVEEDEDIVIVTEQEQKLRLNYNNHGSETMSNDD